jgi:hypothetical protein
MKPVKNMCTSLSLRCWLVYRLSLDHTEASRSKLMSSWTLSRPLTWPCRFVPLSLWLILDQQDKKTPWFLYCICLNWLQLTDTKVFSLNREINSPVYLPPTRQLSIDHFTPLPPSQATLVQAKLELPIKFRYKVLVLNARFLFMRPSTIFISHL